VPILTFFICCASAAPVANTIAMAAIAEVTNLVMA
jgi:hypothetical protein